MDRHRVWDDQYDQITAHGQDIGSGIYTVDAIVLPPVNGRAADTLRLMARRRGIPFLAETSPQTGGIYLGPDNFAAGRGLGTTAGRLLAGQLEEARILMVSLEDLPNTRARCDGFLAGFSVGGEGSILIETLRVDKVFLSIDGISARFGASLADERLALAARRFVEASREVFVLADHSLVGVEANHRIVPPRALTELITDSGSRPADRLACAEAGLRVILADQEAEPEDNFAALGLPTFPDRMNARN